MAMSAFGRSLCVALLLDGFAVMAQQPAPAASAPEPCSASQHRQFDYWIGNWEVHDPSGKRVGENRITRIHNGCALLEEWRGNGGVTGTSLNAFDRDRDRWHQTWVDSTGGLLTLEGGLVDGAMSLRGENVEAGPPRKRTLQRIRWQPQSDGRVRQLWEASSDEGTTWTTAFDGWYTRKN
jgi:hypothetical protein